MTTVFTGASNAISPGAADFMAGHSFERIGAPEGAGQNAFRQHLGSDGIYVILRLLQNCRNDRFFALSGLILV